MICWIVLNAYTVQRWVQSITCYTNITGLRFLHPCTHIIKEICILLCVMKTLKYWYNYNILIQPRIDEYSAGYVMDSYNFCLNDDFLNFWYQIFSQTYLYDYVKIWIINLTSRCCWLVRERIGNPSASNASTFRQASW